MAGIPHLELSLAARPTNVGLVRDAISGLADAVGLADLALDDVLTAVSEAANNVVLHAYDDPSEPFWVSVSVGPERLGVMVRDRGRGMPGEREGDGHGDAERHSGPWHGVGLAAMAAFSTDMRISDGPRLGTEVRLCFDAACQRPPPPQGDVASRHEPLASQRRAAGRVGGPVLGSEILLDVRPAALASPVLTRLVIGVGAHAGFTIDRLSDAELVAASLADGAGLTGLSLAEMHVSLGYERHMLELAIGPCDRGTPRRLLELAALGAAGSVIERLADSVEIRTGDSGEVLHVRLDDRRPAIR